MQWWYNHDYRVCYSKHDNLANKPTILNYSNYVNCIAKRIKRGQLKKLIKKHAFNMKLNFTLNRKKISIDE